MIRKFKRYVALFLVLLFTAAFTFPTLADELMPINEHDAEKLTAFWHQSAYNGLNNGEVVYDHEWPSVNYFSGDPSVWSYDGSWNTRLVTYNYEDEHFSMEFDYTEYFWIYDDSGPFGPIEGTGIEEVRPDLYGPLDLEGTNLYSIETTMISQTHITSVNLNDCTKLISCGFSGQAYCTSISALGMEHLERFSAMNGAFKHIAFIPQGYEQNVELDALGCGTIGSRYSNSADQATTTLYAYPKQDKFVGWFDTDWQLVSTEREYTVTEGVKLIAYFGGDANGDGEITSSDALIIMRQALGISELSDDQDDMDVNCSGAVDAGDALMVLRLSLGLE